MSSLCSTPSVQQTTDLVYGYIRPVTLDGIIVPSDICQLCHRFYNENIYWSITGKDMEEFMDAANDKQISLYSKPTFAIQGIRFSLNITPKYNFYHLFTPNLQAHPIEDTPYIRMSVSCKDGIPHSVSKIAIYCVLFCYEMNYEFRHLWLVKSKRKRSHSIGWYAFGVRYQHVLQQQLKHLTFGCFLKVMHIQYHHREEKHSKEAEQRKTDECTDDDHGLEREHKEAFKTNIVMNAQCKYEWILSEEELNMFKTAAVDYSLYSPNFNGDTFCIVVAPNGLSALNCNGCVLQKLKLLKLPYGVTGILCEYEIVLSAVYQDGTVKEWKRTDVRTFDYSDTGKNDPDCSFTLDLLGDAKQIKFTVSMTIKAVTAENRNQVSANEWCKYSIIE